MGLNVHSNRANIITGVFIFLIFEPSFLVFVLLLSGKSEVNDDSSQRRSVVKS